MSPIGSIRKIGLYFRKYIFFSLFTPNIKGVSNVIKARLQQVSQLLKIHDMFGAWYHITHSQSVFLYIGLFPLLSYLFLSKYQNHFESFTVSKESDDKAKKSHKLQSSGFVNMHKWLHGGKINRFLVCCIWCRCSTVCEK